MNDQQFIDKLYDYGHFWSPNRPSEVTKADLHKLNLDSAVTKVAVRSYQTWFKPELDAIAQQMYGRAAVCDGLAGSATKAVIQLGRCPCPDYANPEIAQAGFPESCRMDLTTSYRLTLRGLDDEAIKRLWLEADQNIMDAIAVGLELKNEQFSNTNIYSYQVRLSRNVLADQFLATGSCGFRSRGRFNSLQTWNDPLFVTTTTHEHIHALGAPHVNDRSATMFPSITGTSMGRRGRLNESDIRILEAQGYKRTTPTDPDGPTGPTDPPTDPGPGPAPEPEVTIRGQLQLLLDGKLVKTIAVNA